MQKRSYDDSNSDCCFRNTRIINSEALTLFLSGVGAATRTRKKINAAAIITAALKDGDRKCHLESRRSGDWPCYDKSEDRSATT